MRNASGAQVKYGQLKSALKSTVVVFPQGRVHATFVVPNYLVLEVNPIQWQQL